VEQAETDSRRRDRPQPIAEPVGAVIVEWAARKPARAVVGTAGTLREHRVDNAREREGFNETGGTAGAHGFRVTGHRYPSLDRPDPNGKERVDGSSPSEGLKIPANQHFVLSTLNRG
jgi:hypothetical protein